VKNINKLQIVFVVALILGVAACSQTPAARFYTLSPMASSDGRSEQSIPDKHIIGIGPVKVAAYLDRSEIVTRSSPTHVELAGFDRWAEPFEDIVASTLAKNISALLPSVHAIIDPWPEANIEYQLVLKIKKFESDKDGKVYLDVSWGILQHSNRKMKAVYESNIVLPGNSGDFDEITRSMSLALAKLSEEITAEIQKILTD
jgi:uncharacterized lipoprotein YmbA